MVWFLVSQIFSTLISLIQIGRMSDTNKDLEIMIVRLAKENLRWGYFKIEGELTKLGFDISLTTVRNVLSRNGIIPAPVR